MNSDQTVLGVQISATAPLWLLADSSSRSRRLPRGSAGEPPPWTTDRILSTYRFTNAYRAADRVSLYLIREVAYQGDSEVREVFFRVVLFKLFNRIGTWKLLTRTFGELRASEFDPFRYDQVLTDAFDSGTRLYAAAYIMPPADRGPTRKHTTHLRLLRDMLDDRLPERIATCASMGAAFDLLIAFRGVGPFLAYQLATDLNYSEVTDFSEMEFVKAGPGALSGIEKCFTDRAGYTPEDLIRWTADRQYEEFARRDLAFNDLWGRPLQLIDCQNLFCEVDKYARVAHPSATSSSGRTRIKQGFAPLEAPVSVWFPPKWGLNHLLPQAGAAD